MARIAGINIPTNKRAVISLTYIRGIGKTTAVKILDRLRIDHNTKVKDLTEGQVTELRAVVEKEYRVEGDLRRDVLANIKRMIDIKSYRGDRHSRNLPVNGQRTKTNSRTVRGNVRKTMGSGRVKAQKT
jgi:small subunit ribosomal protein S13